MKLNAFLSAVRNRDGAKLNNHMCAPIESYRSVDYETPGAIYDEDIV